MKGMPDGDYDGTFGPTTQTTFFLGFNIWRSGDELVCYAWKTGAGAGSGVRSGGEGARGR